MSWFRGFKLLTATNTGAAMVGGTIATSAAAAALLNRKTKLGAGPSLAAGGAVALAGLGAIAWFGHRLVKAGEKLADEFLGEIEQEAEPQGTQVTS